MGPVDQSASIATRFRNARVAFLVPDLRGGGAERVMLQLAGGFAERGADVDVVVRAATGPLLSLVPAGARLVDLKASRMVTAALPFRRYVRNEAPVAVVSALTHANVVVLAALRLGHPSRAKVIVTEHSHLSLMHAETRPGHSFILPHLIRVLYPRAAAVVAVSTGVGDEIRMHLRAATANVTVIPNAVPRQDLERLALARTDPHAWLTDHGPPIILSVGRLSPDKDQESLLRAFAKVRRDLDCRLLILGEGDDRPKLERLVQELGLTDDVSLPGFSANPYPYYRRAAAFALSSVHEGLPTALLEALALGVPIVSTDCQSGPREILDGGRHGLLVEPGNVAALAEALRSALVDPPRPGDDALVRYSMDSVVERYAGLMGI